MWRMIYGYVQLCWLCKVLYALLLCKVLIVRYDWNEWV